MAQKSAKNLLPADATPPLRTQSIQGRYHSSNGREARLLEHVKKVTQPDDPQAVLNAIDNYAHTTEFFMNVGGDKGKILIDEMNKLSSPPKAILVGNLGCSWYLGQLHCSMSTLALLLV